MKRWVVRHIPTGHYIPDPTGWYNKRGGSFTEPDPDENKARLFKTRRAAINFLGAWCRGKHLSETEYEDGYQYTVGYSIKHVPSRIREDMEIVEIDITLP